MFAVAQATYERIIKARGATGICYRMTIFLTLHLAEGHNIRVEPIVGYINDGTDEIMISHAWIEFGGKKTDISLTRTAHPKAQPTGSLIILDREISRGRASFTYHRNLSAAPPVPKELLADPRFRLMLQHKEIEHARMAEIAKNLKSMRTYLDAAPDGFGYEQFASIISGADLAALIELMADSGPSTATIGPL